MSLAKKISLIIPVYNEAENLDHLLRRLEPVLSSLDHLYELVFVDDGSMDETLLKLKTHREKNTAIKIVEFSRNFGKEAALTAGLDFATGDAVIPLDADLQDPPELILQMVKQWQAGYDVVLAQRRERKGETLLKRKSAEWFYRLLGRFSSVLIPKNTGDFRLMDRKVIEALKQLKERNRFMKGVFAWAGYKTTTITFDRDPRAKGQSKWNYWKLWNYALDGLFSFTNWPLKVWIYIGCFISFLSLFYGVFLVLRTLISGADIPGYAALMVAMLFLGGVQLISLGVIAEYIGLIYNESRRRPIYLVNQSLGFEKPADVVKPAVEPKKVA